MNKIKKIFLTSLVSICAIGTTVYVAETYTFSLANNLQAAQTYEIKLDSNNGKVTGTYSDAENTINCKTNTGYPLTIGYKNSMNSTNNDYNLAQLKAKKGEYYNKTAITNIKEIIVDYSSSNNEIKYAVGKTPHPTNYQTSTTGKINVLSSSKDNYYFTLAASKNALYIKSIVIKYSCDTYINGETNQDANSNTSQENSSETTTNTQTSTDVSESEGNIDYKGYYQDITPNMSGAHLLTTLRSIISKNHDIPSYKGLWEIYKRIDVKADGTMQDYYSNISKFKPGTDQAGNYSGEGDKYNREHSIPKSWWGGDEFNQGADPIIVIPTDGYVNNRRSNYPLGEVDKNNIKYASANSFSLLGASKYTGYQDVSTVFEPADEYKGDFARIHFYAIARYSNAVNWNKGNLSTFTNKGNFGLTEYASKLFLKWHFQDPVSPLEINRNNGIFIECHNRNPFVDHPELVKKIWGSTTF